MSSDLGRLSSSSSLFDRGRGEGGRPVGSAGAFRSYHPPPPPPPLRTLPLFLKKEKKGNYGFVGGRARYGGGGYNTAAKAGGGEYRPVGRPTADIGCGIRQ